MNILIRMKMEDFCCLRKFSVPTFLMRHIFFCLVSLNLSSVATWAENATTVTGNANGTSGSSNSSLYHPWGITISTDDILYIVDNHNCRVVMVNLTSSIVSGIIGSGWGGAIDHFEYPSDAFITETSLYVLDNSNDRIQEWSKDGTNPSTMFVTPSLFTTHYIFIDKYGSIYVNKYNQGIVICFAFNLSVSVTVAGNGTNGNQSDQLNYPEGIYVDDNLTLYIADSSNHRIQMWTYGASFGQTVAGDGSAGSSLTQLNSPMAVIVDINGYMYIADAGNYRVLRWGPIATSGVCIAACTGVSGTNANQLLNPTGLAFDNNGSLYICEFSNNRVQKFEILNKQSKTITFVV
jgi:sugar lactone lactonase YvrE